MESSRQFTIPDELDLLNFFGREPSLKEPLDGLWLFEAEDSRGVHLSVTLNVIERSVQTTIRVQGQDVDTVVSEGATRLTVETADLECQFELQNWRTVLRVQVHPAIRLSWSTLRISG